MANSAEQCGTDRVPWTKMDRHNKMSTAALEIDSFLLYLYSVFVIAILKPG